MLSTTAKAKAREKTKEKEKAAAENGDLMEMVRVSMDFGLSNSHFGQDEKSEVKKEPKTDVDMKDEGSTTAAAHGDVSPINGSLSNLADPADSASAKPEPAKAAEVKKPRKTEPAFEKLPNFSRVTPAQLAHVVFPPDCRYHPIRPVSTRSAPMSSAKGKAAVNGIRSSAPAAALGLASERYAGGGGILLLIDQHPEEPVELMESELVPEVPVATVDETPATAVSSTSSTAPHIALDENAPEADPPEPFEVSHGLYVFSL